MKLKDKIVMCFSNLSKRKVRTLLTTMGVVVGTCAIVITVSLGVGMQASQEAALAQMGDLTIITINGYGLSPDSDPLDDVALEKIREMENVIALTPAYQINEWGSIFLTSGKYKYDGQVFGVYMNELGALGYTLEDGSPIPADLPENAILYSVNAPYDFMNTKKKSNNYIYPGSGKDPYVDLTKDKIFFDVRLPDKGGKTYKAKESYFGGILKEDWSKQPSSGYGIFVDIEYLKKLEADYNKLNNVKINKDVKKSYEQVSVKVDDMYNVASVEEAIQAMGYTTYSMETIRKPMQEKAQKDQMMLGSLGAISLLVAAIGITNTMIMSIYERTREIGVMKVLGCIISDIRTVFLMEAATIGFLGGVLGVSVSYGISYLMNTLGTGAGDPNDFFAMMQGGIGNNSIIPWWLAVGALIFATGVGLLSGIYPANRAVNISALAAIKQD